MNYYGKELNAYKAAFHQHSTVSDGLFTPEQMIEAYSKKGYDIYAFTDHEIANPVSTYDGKGMTLISGMEIHPMGPRGERWHILGLGLPEDFKHPVTCPETTAEECIEAVHKVGGIAFCAHPVFCGFRSEEVAKVKGWDGMEFFNSDCRFAGKGYSVLTGCELADEGILLNSIAVDDAHSRRDFFNGWTMLLTDKPLSQASVIEALKAGTFYATQGPQFTSVNYKDGFFEAEFTPCTEVIGLSFKWRGYCAMCENLNGPEDGIREITSCRIKIKNDIKNNNWFRLQIKDKNGHYAWTNPIWA